MRNLFGGAIQAHVPPEFADVSLLRQVPDNQEVFAHPDSDSSVIFELLESVENVATNDAALAVFHWRNLACEAEASETELLLARDVPSSLLSAEFAAGEFEVIASVACGLQRVAKFKDPKDAANTVRVNLGCVRLPKVSTDLLIVFNEPVKIHGDSSSAKVGCEVSVPSAQEESGLPIVLQSALSSLIVTDWDLFG